MSDALEFLKPFMAPDAPQNSLIRVAKDWRVSWYPDGFAGRGHKRKQERGRTPEGARAIVERLIVQLRVQASAGATASTPLGTAFGAFIGSLEATNAPEGTVRQYKSNWNCHVPERIAAIACANLELEHWTAIFDDMLVSGASASTIKAVTRTLNAFLAWAVDRAYFGDQNPFAASQERRRKAVAGIRKRAPKSSRPEKIALKHCPRPDQVHLMATFAEQVMPGYGRLLVLLTFASGLRFTEVLGLRVEHIDLATGSIAVEQQIDRYRPWPAVRNPKGGKTRTTFVWTAYKWVLEKAVQQASQHEGEHNGWLFPPDKQVTGWADRANRLINRDAVAKYSAELPSDAPVWAWTHHWFRHAFATWSLASPAQGGLGLERGYVSDCLGHADTATTEAYYVDALPDEADRARRITAQVPWTVTRD